MARSLAVITWVLLFMSDCMTTTSSAPNNPLAGRVINGEFEVIVRTQSDSLLGGLLGNNSEQVSPTPLKLAFDTLGNVFQFSPVGENGKFEKGEVLKLNQEVDFASHPERIDPRTLANFSISVMKFRTSLVDRVLSVFGVLDFVSKSDGSRLQQTMRYQIAFSPAFTDCTVQSYASKRTVGPPQSITHEVSLTRSIRCAVSQP